MSEEEVFESSPEIVIDDRWKSSDFENLFVLWDDNLKIEDISSTLEKSVFSTVKTIAWKTKSLLSEVIEKVANEENLSIVKQIYVSDYPNLVNVDIKQDERQELVNKNLEEKESKFQLYKQLTSIAESIDANSEISGLEQVLEKLFFKNKIISTIEGREIREKLVWLSAFSELFDLQEYKIFYTVFPSDGGSRLTYSEAQNELSVPKYKISLITRTCINKLVNWKNVLGDDKNSYSNWITLPLETLATLNYSNRQFFLPKVDINYDEIPKLLITLDEFDFPQSSIEKLNKEGFYCLGDLANTDYQQLRVVHGIRSDIATNIMSIYESYKSEF
jgi:hypothetical protein